MSLALYRKWRPMTFSDVVGQPQVTDTLRRQIAQGRLSHAYLFTGTRGTGKTTCAKLLAKAANCLDLHDGEPCNQCAACRAINEGAAVDVSEIDAASNNGVDNIRELRDNAAYAPVELKYRVYIIDECHMLSNSAWNALLKILEEPPEHVIFIFASTELNKIPPTILSRCQRYSFRRGNTRDLAQRVSEIAAAEQIPLTEDGAAALARLADGAFRDAISMLDQCAAARQGEKLDEAAILDELGLAGADDTLTILQSVAAGDMASALSILDRLYSAGKDMSAFLGELAAAIRDELIMLTTHSPALLGGRYAASALEGLGLSAPAASAMLAAVSDAQARLARASSARIEVELCLVKLTNIAAGGEAIPAPQPAAPAPARPAAPAPMAAAPAEPEDTPPWDDDPAPKSAPAPATVAIREEDEIPPPLDEDPPAPEQPVATEQSGWWQDVLLDARPSIPISHFMQVNSQPPAKLSGDVAIITVSGDFTRRIVGDQKVLDALSRSASKVLGRSITVRCVMEGQEQRYDAFDELLNRSEKFDNFTISD